MIGVASSEKVKNNGKKERICRIMVDVASKRWGKTKMGHEADEPSNEKMDKQKKNEGDKIDNATMKGDCNCHQSKIFEKKISAK